MTAVKYARGISAGGLDVPSSAGLGSADGLLCTPGCLSLTQMLPAAAVASPDRTRSPWVLGDLCPGLGRPLSLLCGIGGACSLGSGGLVGKSFQSKHGPQRGSGLKGGKERLSRGWPRARRGDLRWGLLEPPSFRLLQAGPSLFGETACKGSHDPQASQNVASGRILRDRQGRGRRYRRVFGKASCREGHE